MLAISPLPSIATNQTERSWKASLFRRRRSLPQIRASFWNKKSSQSSGSCTGEDTLNSGSLYDPFFEYTINDNSSFSIIDVPPDNPPLMPLGQDQLVVSTSISATTMGLDSPLHHPKDPEVSIRTLFLNFQLLTMHLLN